MRTSAEPTVESYSSADHFELERDAVWATSWVSICRVEDVADAGDFVSATVASDPVVVVRDRDGELRCFGNVCSHRNTTIMHGSGTAHALQCPYHLWTFRLDGTLAAAPEMADVTGFRTAEFCLPTIAVDEWNGWVFVNLDNSADHLATQLPQLTERVAEFDLSSLRRAGSIRHEQPWNWKITVENFGESYHHAAVHPTTLQGTYPGQRSWVGERTGEPWFWLDHVSVDEEAEPFAVIVAFPAHMFSIIRGLGMVWFRVEAKGAQETLVEIELFLPEGLCADNDLVEEVLDSLQTINDQDAAINARVQSGLASRWANHGPLNQLEDGCRQFREWLAATTGQPADDTRLP